MAQSASSPSHIVLSACRSNSVRLRRCFWRRLAAWGFILLGSLFGGSVARAQAPPQQYLYGSVPLSLTTSEIASYAKNSDGTLTQALGSPFPDNFQGGAMVIDGQGRFLFVVNPSTSNISMFQINQTNGALVEVPGSPFSTGPTENLNLAPRSPVCLAAEKSGQFLYVGYQFGNFQGQGSVNEYLIDAANLQVVPLPGQPTTDIASSPMGMFTDPKGLHLYVGLGLNQFNAMQDAGILVYSIDALTGQLMLTGSAGNAQNLGRSMALDMQGRFFFDGWGTLQSFIESAIISPNDGTATTITSSLALAVGDAPLAMLAESSGKFLYVQQTSGAFLYLIDQTTGALTAASVPLTVLSFASGSAAADPLGPYIYSFQQDGIHGFLVDPQIGALSEISGSPFTVGSVARGTLAISGSPTQAASGPVAALFPASEDFGPINLGQSSNPQIVTITNTGGQGLTLNSVTITGSNPTDFTAAPSCSIPTVLPPNTTCTITVTFSPVAVGTRQANLTVADNAPASPQSIPLTGTGVAPQPAVTLVPGSLVFPSTDQGSTSASQTVTLTNSGTATLNISSVLLSGSNPGDFTMANSCAGAYAANASCTINVAFAPLAGGERTASIAITDNAPGSPQSVSVSGTGIGTPVPKPGVTLTPASLSFGTVTQGTSTSPQTVTVTSSGTATLHISSVILSGANSSEFTMNNTCVPGAYAVNSTCTVALAFAPVTTGPHTATVSVTDDAADSPQMIALGAAVNPAFTIVPTASGGTSVTISAGQTAAFNLQITPATDFSGSLSWICAGAPLASTCSAPPVPLSGAPITYTVSVATTGHGAIVPIRTLPVWPQLTAYWSLISVWLVLLFLWTSTRRRRWRGESMRVIEVASFCAFLLAIVLGSTGCGGGSIAAPTIQSPSVIVTPQGIFTITLTPNVTTSTGKQLSGFAPIQLTLTVN